MKCRLDKLTITTAPTYAVITAIVPLTDDLLALEGNYSPDKKYTLEIKNSRESRSLDANAYSWVLIGKIAEYLRTDKESVYLEMLKRYSRKFTHVIMHPGAVDTFKQNFRTVAELGEVTVNGQTGIQLQCYYGSSTFDTKEMSVFIDGIVSECEQMGIPTKDYEDVERMKGEWGN